MTLTLTVLRCPDAVPPETRRVTGGDFTIGRNPDNDWVLADPERHLSKRHCVIAFRSGAWQLADTSANGTFLNRDSEPLGAGAPRTLADGDRIRLGPYEIEVRLQDDRAQSAFERSAPFRDDPFAADPFAPSAAGRAGFGGGRSEVRFDAGLASSGISMAPVSLPIDFDPLAPDADREALAGPTQPDHSMSVSDAFQTPLAHAVLPADWHLDASLSGSVRVPAAPVPPMRAESAAPKVAAHPPAEEEAGGLLAAFLRGAEMPATAPADPPRAMEQLGGAFRAMVSGLRRVLIARAAVKGEFRIGQTMIRARGNNPLKFSADDEDALAALLGTGRRTDMSPEEAVADALTDIRLHELATMAAMQRAVRALVDRFAPDVLRAAAEQGSGLPLPAMRKARAWDSFEALHATVTRGLSDDFDSVFGKEFARAYEQALAEIARRGEDR